MAFSGLSTNKLFTPNLVGEDISEIIRTLSPYEAPLLDWLGDGSGFATSPKHEYIEDFMRPRYVIASVAVNSVDTATYIGLNALAEGLTVGTLLENEGAAPEIMQVTSILSANTVNVNRNYDGAGVGSVVVGSSLFVRWPAAEEGHEHSGVHTTRLGVRRANTVGYFNVEIGATGTAMAASTLGGDTYETSRAKRLQETPALLEAEVVRGVLNASNSLGSTTLTRTMKGLRGWISTINSTVAATSFAADPHLYIGNIWEQVFQQGASASESWAIVAGRTFFRNISDLNDTHTYDSQQTDLFRRVVRTYEGAFGQGVVILSRALPATELMLIPRERVRVVPLQGRNFTYREMGATGDNTKGMIIGEYTCEVHHPNAMARLRV